MEDIQQKNNQSIFEDLRKEYIKVLNDKDVLINWGKPQLEALYITRIGYLQIEKLQLQLRIKALKRKIELVMAKINREEEVDIIAIELQVAEELALAEQKILKESLRFEKAEYLLSNLASPTRSKELKDLYKQYAKQLHPDVNENLTAEQIDLWHIVQQAYQTGDLEKLRAIKVIYEKELNKVDADFKELSEEDILLKIEILKEGIKIIDADILKIKEQFPFNMQDKITNEDWVNQEKNNVQEELNALKKYEDELSLKYQYLVNSL
jgi:hypothetical protein